jgi:Holliday junction resolvase-like predicted endonuclease
MNGKHQRGQISEAICALHLSRRGWWVFAPIFALSGPVDLVAVHPRGYVALVDVKTDSRRRLAGRSNTYAISRVRSPLQKRLRVLLAYTSDEGIRWKGASAAMKELLK